MPFRQKGNGKNSAKWWYNHLDGTYPKSSWAWIDGNGDGLAECYYFDQQGWLVVNKTVEGYKVDSTGAWLENGAVQVKSVSESGVFTNGKNEVSNGTIDMESDLELGTADKAAVSAEDKASVAVQDKTGSVLEVSGRFGGPGEGTSDFSSNPAVVAANGDMSDLIGYARSLIRLQEALLVPVQIVRDLHKNSINHSVFLFRGIRALSMLHHKRYLKRSCRPVTWYFTVPARVQFIM